MSDDTESQEQVFAEARDAEAASEEFLLDDGWQVTIEPEPVIVKVHSNGSNGNRHVVEPVVNNVHQEEPADGQQSLCSWVEFLA